MDTGTGRGDAERYMNISCIKEGLGDKNKHPHMYWTLISTQRESINKYICLCVASDISPDLNQLVCK